MARIPLPSSSSDLFETMSLQQDVPERLRRKIVRLCSKEFGNALKRASFPLMAEIVGKVNRATGSSMSLVSRKSLLVTVLVVEVNGEDVIVELCFRDLKNEKVAGKVMDELWGELAKRAHFPKGLEVRSGALIGHIKLPSNVVPLPQPRERPGSQWKEWPRSSQGVEAEKESLRALRVIR